MRCIHGVVTGLLVAGLAAGQQGGKRPAAGGKPALIKPAESLKLVPLTELGDQEYQGFKGGLYPGGTNERPAEHEKSGLALAKQVQPLDAAGKPSPAGKIVLLSIGMSNTNQASQGFERHLAKADDINPRFLFVNGAQSGMTAARIQDPTSQSGELYWDTVEKRLKQAGVTPAQVQAVWIKQADAQPKSGFPAYAKQLQAELARIVQLLPERFPNCKLAYLSGRTYGGFATIPLNPEPYAYESGFSVKWLIEDQLKGEPALNYDPKRGAVKAPWLSWGPQLWANGATKRADGFYYVKEDFGKDGTHHSPAGQLKIGGAVMEFFRSDATTRPWFLKRTRYIVAACGLAFALNDPFHADARARTLSRKRQRFRENIDDANPPFGQHRCEGV
jgi:hypothetical protein